jgi:hypothetical protein
MLRVRAAIGRLDGSWPAFDIALSLYWERKHPGESLVTFLRKSSSIAKAADVLRLSEQITSTIDQFVGGFGIVGIGYRLLNLAGQAASRKHAVNQLRRDLPAFQALVEEQDPDRMLGYLPVLLAYDLERVRQNDPALVICLVDTFEAVQALPAERRGLEDLVSRLVYLMPNVLFIAGSRRPLLWHDPVRSIGLTYGGELRWPGLAGLHGRSDQFTLDGFDDASADQYLQERLTQDGRPLIPAGIRRRIIDGAAGSPHYLELSAGLVEQIVARGGDLAPELFGGPFPELVLRLMRDLSPEDRDLLRAAALLEAFDRQILAIAVPRARERQIEGFLERYFVRRYAGVWPPYRLHENLRKGVALSDGYTPDGWTDNERRRVVLRTTTHLEGTVLSIWDDGKSHSISPQECARRAVAAFLVALYAAHEHAVLPPRLGHMAYTLHELGHWQVLASLPEYADTESLELAQLTAIARLAARADLDAGLRYEQMKALTGDVNNSAYAPYAHFHLGNLALICKLNEADRHFAAIADDSSVLASAAVFGRAGAALRQSRFRLVQELMHRPFASQLDQIRATDMLAILQMHNARFEQAAELFAANLERARQADAPLWVARSARHLAMTYMWFDPSRALALIPEAREINQSLGDSIGINQCDTAAALAHGLRGEWLDTERLLVQARTRREALGAPFGMTLIDVIEVLLHLAMGRSNDAQIVARELISATHADPPRGHPVWAAVAAMWVERPDWFDFNSIDWIEPNLAHGRWRVPLERVLANRIYH